MVKKVMPPIQPGEILFEEFMEPWGISQNRLGRDIGISPRRIREIIHGKRAITADTALRLSAYFGNSAKFWIGLQSDYELELAQDQVGARIKERISPLVRFTA